MMNYLQSNNRFGRIWALLFFSFLLFNSVAAEGKKYNVFSCGKTSYTIVVSKSTQESEIDAAEELRAYLKQIRFIRHFE